MAACLGLSPAFGLFDDRGVALADASDEEIAAEVQRRTDVREAVIKQAARERAEQDRLDETAHLDARFQRVRVRWAAKHREVGHG